MLLSKIEPKGSMITGAQTNKTGEELFKAFVEEKISKAEIVNKLNEIIDKVNEISITKSAERTDTRSQINTEPNKKITVDLPRELILKLALMAHEQDVTFNSFCRTILKNSMMKLENDPEYRESFIKRAKGETDDTD